MVFISGGSSGIGLALARRATQSGAHVAIAARGAERLEEARRSLLNLRASPEQKVHGFVLDVSDAAACGNVAASVLAEFGRCDIVIANAGISHPARTLETPVEVFEKMIRTNYLGTVHTVRAFLPTLLSRGEGKFGIVSSMLGFMGLYGYSAYAASKFAQVGFAESLRHELVDRNISITLCFPPDTDTPQLQEDNLIKPPETAALSEEVQMVSADFVAGEFLKAIDKGKWQVVPGAMGRLVEFLARHFPRLWRTYVDAELRKFRRKTGAPIR